MMISLSDWIDKVYSDGDITIGEQIALRNLRDKLSENEQMILLHLFNGIFNMGTRSKDDVNFSIVTPEPDDPSIQMRVNFLNKLSVANCFHFISQICDDWDGYRTAEKLGELINEIWGYVDYFAEKFENE